MSSPARVGRIGPGLSLLGQILLQLAPVQVLQGGFENWLSIELGLGARADEAVDLVIAHPPGGVSHADEGSFLEVVRAVVAGLLIIGDLRDFYGYNSPSLDLLHREAGAKRRLHLGGQATEVLLKLAGVAHAHGLEAGVLV
jgi:hypothetical protein